MKFMNRSRLVLLSVLGMGVPVWGQLSVSVQQLSFQMPEGGPLQPDPKVTVTSARPWKVTTSDPDVVSPNPATGTGTGTFTAVPVSWRRPGMFTATITVTDDQNNLRSISVTLVVLTRLEARITYPAGEATGCVDAPGLPALNAALCTVPNENPLGSFTPPAPGGTYVDPNFGGRVRILTGPESLHGYSTPSPISATNRYALLASNDEVALVELATGKVAKKLAVGIEGTLWDAHNDSWLYTFSGATIRRLDVNSGQVTVTADYSRVPYQFQSISSGGTGEISKDNWISFFAPQEHQICALDVTAVKTYCGAIPNNLGVDYTTMAKGVDRVSGFRYVLLIPNNGQAFLLYSVNQTQGRLDFVSLGPESVYMNGGNRDGICDAGEPCVKGGHSDTMEDSSGNQLLMMAVEEQTPCGYSFYSVQLNKGNQMGVPVELGGGLKRTLPLFRCGGVDIWADYHVGCAKTAPLCAISTTVQLFNQVRDPTDSSPLRRTAYLGEIMVMRDNGTEVRRLTQHRSVQFKTEESNGYWSTPRAAISPDGSVVIYTSNFGVPNQHRVVVADTGFAQPRLAAGNPVVNAASYESKLAPGVLAVTFGSHLAACTQTATFPLPVSICGTSVQVGANSARMLYATPDQLAFLVPGATPPNVDTQFRVQVSAPNGDVASAAAVIPASAMLSSAPALFAQATPGLEGTNTVRLWEPSGQEITSVRLGDYAIGFAVGLGATIPAVGEGQPSSSDTFSRVVTQPNVYINDVRQELLFAGLIPGISGIYQLNFQVNPTTPIHPDLNWLWLNAGGVESPRLLVTLLPPT